MKKKKFKLRKVRIFICIFFLFSVLSGYTQKINAVDGPPLYIPVSGGRQPTSQLGVYVEFIYDFNRISYDRKTGTALYSAGQHFIYEGKTKVLTDILYVNGKEIGRFKSLNGTVEAGTYYRTEKYNVVFHEGWNLIETKGEGGVGGDSRKNVYVDIFSDQPVTYKDWDGRIINSQTVGYDTCAVQPPNPSRPGYVFTGWSRGNCNITTPTEIIAQYNALPTISATNKKFYEGQYSSSTWQNTIRWQGLSANDKEDGNITSKIKIISDNVNVNKSGTYQVKYSVTDSYGNTATTTSTVTVLFNNPPSIVAEDRWFYVDEDVNNTRLLERVVAGDKEDGDISSKAYVSSSNVRSGVIGDYKVTYKVVDKYGKSATTNANIHIVDNDAENKTKFYARHINKRYLNTLKLNSKWVTDPTLKTQLNITLAKAVNPTDANAVQIWEIKASDVKKIKDHNKRHGMSTSANISFLSEFGYLRVK